MKIIINLDKQIHKTDVFKITYYVYYFKNLIKYKIIILK
jgi:hypothetical protein